MKYSNAHKSTLQPLGAPSNSGQGRHADSPYRSQGKRGGVLTPTTLPDVNAR